MYFIDKLEHNRAINEVGSFVFMEACKTLKKWNDMGYHDLCMSINISEKQFEEDNFLTKIDYILNQTQVNPNFINLEITERYFINPTENVLKILKALRAKGIKIYIDDFGTKYSSLGYLCTFPIDGIKLDKAFIDRIHTSPKELIIIKNIINLAEEIGIEVVAEGVEKEEQLNLLSKVKCHKIQGFYFAKPIDSVKFIDFLTSWNSN